MRLEEACRNLICTVSAVQAFQMRHDIVMKIVETHVLKVSCNLTEVGWRLRLGRAGNACMVALLQSRS